MANLVYERVSTDQQSTARQNLILDEAGIEDPVVFEEDPGTSSRLHPLQRPKFRELLTYARPGDTVYISEMRRAKAGGRATAGAGPPGARAPARQPEHFLPVLPADPVLGRAPLARRVHRR
ncbi:recombinase family protein [Streptomyces mirabilis]|uniref:recombinase family protein n=1 Tax=Streptomyces mirabilis TaxID=68239 RepID=UPI0022500583|nr:recombinase family protein [Streptomyces mirabilis]MCX4609472.1 recombinase family protein [Streptomyces mirabilis]